MYIHIYIYINIYTCIHIYIHVLIISIMWIGNTIYIPTCIYIYIIVFMHSSYVIFWETASLRWQSMLFWLVPFLQIWMLWLENWYLTIYSVSLLVDVHKLLCITSYLLYNGKSQRWFVLIATFVKYFGSLFSMSGLCLVRFSWGFL